jgi:hypothetical protein
MESSTEMQKTTDTSDYFLNTSFGTARMICQGSTDSSKSVTGCSGHQHACSKSVQKRAKRSCMLDANDILQSSYNGISTPVYGLNRLRDSFYNVPCEDLAKGLLGKVLVRRLSDGTLIKGRIVETECYLGGEDKASHSYNGRITERSKPMYMKPGTAYVYITYGMYHCFNISSQGLWNSLPKCTVYYVVSKFCYEEGG